MIDGYDVYVKPLILYRVKSTTYIYLENMMGSFVS
jgi:hypothetical protein